MKIDNTGNPLPTITNKATPARTTAADRSYGNVPAETAKDSTKVNINPLASQLQSLESRLAQQPAVDAQRVGEIQQAIREGRFNINPEVIADKLVASVKELLGDR